MTSITKKTSFYAVIMLILVLCTVIPVQGISGVAYAAENTASFDSTNVLDDLLSSTVDGKSFDLKAYPYNELGSLQVINFVEYCYSYKRNMQTNYGLYLYVYNPQGLNLSTNSKQNKVQMAVAYNSTGEVARYEKFNLEFCSRAEESNYKNLFYKFKVVDKRVDGKTFIERVNSNERRYDISGLELLTYGQQNATEYGVGGTYKFTGYVKGYGPDATAKSTLSCVVENLETLALEVHPTNYRTNLSNLGKDHYNEVNSVYFSVPERVYNTYGFLQKIRAEWWEYKTKMAAVTSNRDFYNQMMQYVGKDVGDHDGSVPVYLYSGYAGQAGGAIGAPTIHNYYWTYNVDLSTRYTKLGTVSEIHNCGNVASILPYAFYSPVVGIDSVFDFLYSDPIAGDVESTQVAEWIYNYKNNLGHGYIDCNGREISADLFEDAVDSGRTRGYNDKTIDLSDTFNLNSYDSNHSWWDKLWDYGFSWPQTNGDYSNVSPIYEIQSNDLVGTNSAVSDKLLVNENDVTKLQAYYAAEKIKGNRVVLFRFAQTDYYSAPAFTPHTENLNNTDTYVAQETVFFDFDIIELTFNKDGVYHVIPVVASPIDVINGFTAPAVELEWWKILLGIILLIILLVLLAPIMPYIIRALIWVISLPFKFVKWIIKSAKEYKKAKAPETSVSKQLKVKKPLKHIKNKTGGDPT